MGRRPCCSKVGLNRGPWTAEEDKLLSEFIKLHGEGRWRKVPIGAGLKRCGKSCRLRWLNYLKPDIKRGNITHDEEELIVRLHKLLGNRWSLIARRLPGRTDNEIKNYWNTSLARRVHHGDGKSSTKKVPNNKRKKTEVQELEPPNCKTIPVETPVVRPKAARCSKAFFTNPQKQQRTVTSNDYFDDHKEQEKPSFHDHSSISYGNKNEFSSGDSDLLSPFTTAEAKNPSDSMLHYTVEELQFFDLLSLESSSYCDFSCVNYTNMINLDHSSPSDSPLFFYDEMLLRD